MSLVESLSASVRVCARACVCRGGAERRGGERERVGVGVGAPL